MGIQEVTPDMERAKSLYKMALDTYQMVQTIDGKKFPSNVIKEYYDIIRQFIDITLLLRGYKTFGEGAHEEAIALAHKEGTLNATEFFLANELRKKRNRMSYEGHAIEYSYVVRNKEAILQLIHQLRTKIEKILEL